MVMPMEVEIKLDKQGRIVLPKEIRDRYHLQPNSDLILIDQSNGLLIKPKPAKKSLKEIADNAPSCNLDEALVLDIANFNEEDV